MISFSYFVFYGYNYRLILFTGTNGTTFLESSDETDTEEADIINDDGSIDSDVNEYLVSFDTSTFYTTASGALGGPGSFMFINNPFAGYIEDDRNVHILIKRNWF